MTRRVRVAARGHDLALLNVEVRRQVSTEPLREALAGCGRTCSGAATRYGNSTTRTPPSWPGSASSATCPRRPRPRWPARWEPGGPATKSCPGWPATSSGATAGTLARRREIDASKRIAAAGARAAEERLSAAEPGPPGRSRGRGHGACSRRRAWTEAEIELTYHVSSSSWRPLYDLVLDGERLKVSYLAEITQRTGEDWPEAELVLSTTRQARRQGLPELSPGISAARSRPAFRCPRPAVSAEPPAGVPAPPRAAGFAGVASAAPSSRAPGREGTRRRAGGESESGAGDLHGGQAAGGAGRRQPAQDPDRQPGRRLRPSTT